jgi:hypothetical protein
VRPQPRTDEERKALAVGKALDLDAPLTRSELEALVAVVRMLRRQLGIRPLDVGELLRCMYA